MNRNYSFVAIGLLLAAVGTVRKFATAAESNSTPQTAVAAASSAPVGFFAALGANQINAKYIAKNDHEARLLITNNTAKPISLKLPDAFVGVPVLAQFGGGGGGRGGGGFGGGGRSSGGGGGGQQSSGGGLGGGGGGGGLGGGGGVFSIPPEKTAAINFPVLCLNHGLRDPSSSTAYAIVPPDALAERPAVIELLKAFGSGKLNHQAAQAAVWHLNSDMGWDQLAAKLQGTRRSLSRPPYFSRQEIQAGMTYAQEATRLAEANADEYREMVAARDAAPTTESSEERSTKDVDAKEPTATDEPADAAESESSEDSKSSEVSDAAE